MSLYELRKDDIDHHLAKYPDKLSAVMPLLYIAQEEYGYITDEAIAEIADIEFLLIDKETRLRQFRNELRWNRS